MLGFRKRGTNAPRSFLQVLLRTMSPANVATNETLDLLAEEILMLRRPGYVPVKGQFDFFPQFLQFFSLVLTAPGLLLRLQKKKVASKIARTYCHTHMLSVSGLSASICVLLSSVNKTFIPSLIDECFFRNLPKLKTRQNPTELRHHPNLEWCIWGRLPCVLGAVPKNISLEKLRRRFHMPTTEVARHFGICVTLLRKVCRRLNIKRWPNRQIRKIDNCVQSLQVAMQNADTDGERRLFKRQIGALKNMRKSVVDDPSSPHVSLGASAKGLKIGSDASNAKRNKKEKGKTQEPEKKDKSPAKTLSVAPQVAQSVLTNQTAEQIVQGLNSAVALLLANQATTKATGTTAYYGMTIGNSQPELLSRLYDAQTHAPVSNASNAQLNAYNAQLIGKFLRMQNSSSQNPVTSKHATNAYLLNMEGIPANSAPSFNMNSLHTMSVTREKFNMLNTFYHQKLLAQLQPMQDVFNIRTAQAPAGRAFTSTVAFNSSTDNNGGDYAPAVANALAAEPGLTKGLLPSFTSILQKAPNSSVATPPPAHNSQNFMAEKNMVKNLVPAYIKTDWTPLSAQSPQLTENFPFSTLEGPQQLTGEQLPSTCRRFFSIVWLCFLFVSLWVGSFFLSYCYKTFEGLRHFLHI
jgi:hypothetical protein